MNEKILITSALPYANGLLHFGHIAGAFLPADCYARFQRLQKNSVLYVCGSDEYGIAVALSAKMAGSSPQQHVDFYHAQFQHFFKQLNISFDHYSRTTEKEHATLTQQFFLQLLKEGYIEERVSEQLYSAQDNAFLADRYVIGTCPKCGYEKARGDECTQCGACYEAIELINPRSKLSDSVLERRQTNHWYLLLDQFKEPLQQWLADKKWKGNVLNFVKNFIRDLKARAITRDSSWGVPLPLEKCEDKVLYVWFDAPIGYISATKEWAEKEGNPDAWKEFWCNPQTKLVQFIGKDNIPFHAIIFPLMLMGQKEPYKLVDELPANEFYLLEGRQFSKSDGWTIDTERFFQQYTADQIRYMIATTAPEVSDSEFSWKGFQLRCNTDLVGKYGNFIHRVLQFSHKYGGGKIPVARDLDEQDQVFLHEIKALSQVCYDSYRSFSLRRASQAIMDIAQRGNVYFDRKKVWLLRKEESSRQRMDNALKCCFECIKLLALTSFPIIPQTAEKVWEMIGESDPLAQQYWFDIVDTALPEGREISTPTVLFTKIEDATIQNEIRLLSEQREAALKQQSPRPEKARAAKETIDVSTFHSLDLRIGIIREARKVAKSKRLLVLQVDLGETVKQIVSGIAEYYTPEVLVGRKVMVVANLTPNRIMGLASEAMVLTAEHHGQLELVTVHDAVPGSCVT